MIKFFRLACFTTLGLIIPSLAADQSKEPPLGYTLRIEGQNVRVEAGSETTIQGKFENPKVLLEPDTERHFTYAALDFRYPAYFAFKAEMETEGIRIWTLSGNSCVLMIQHYQAVEMTVEDFANALKDQYGKSATVKPISRKFNNQTYNGLQVIAKLAGAKITQDVLPFNSKGGSRFLMIQQSDGDSDVSKAESGLVVKLLNTTLDIKPLLKEDSNLN